MIDDNISQETRINDAMSAAGMAWWEVELPSGAVFFHPDRTKMLGVKPDDFVHYTSFTKLIHPDDLPGVIKAMEDLIAGVADTYETKYRIKHADGKYRLLYDKGKIVQRSGNEMRIAGMILCLHSLKKL